MSYSGTFQSATFLTSVSSLFVHWHMLSRLEDTPIGDFAKTIQRIYVFNLSIFAPIWVLDDLDDPDTRLFISTAGLRDQDASDHRALESTSV